MNLFLLLVSLIQPSITLNPSIGCGGKIARLPPPGHSHLFDLTVTDPQLGKTTRLYQLHVPAKYQLSNDYPTPLVVDFHSWGGTINSHHKVSLFRDVADEDDEGFFVATPQGMGDEPDGWASFNVSNTDGPLGPPCELDRVKWGEINCYASCSNCNSTNSCDWTSCHDDIAFTKAIIDTIADSYCVDLDSVHQSGSRNGGMFSYYLPSLLDDFATIAPVSASPLLGFLNRPQNALSIIDFHGYNNRNIPYDLIMSEGAGPSNTLTSLDGYYYYDKPRTIQSYADWLECGPTESWPTIMDGIDNFKCFVHKKCKGDGEIVHCNGDFGHQYPFGPHQYIEGTRIIWSFMKTHPKQYSK